MTAREEVKKAHSALIGLTKNCEEWHRCHALVANYLDHPLEDPDAEVWAEISDLVKQTDYSLYGRGDGYWGLVENQRVGNTLYDKSKLLDVLKELTAPIPTLETETAARQRAEEKLNHAIETISNVSKNCHEAEEKLAMAAESIRTLSRMHTATKEKLATAQERLAESESPVVLCEYKADSRVHRVSRGRVAGKHFIEFYGVFKPEWMQSSRPGISDSYLTEREAQAALDACAKEHDWQEVKP